MLRAELGVVRAGDNEHGHPDATQPGPQRVLRSCSGLSKALGQSRDRVLPTFRTELHRLRETGEERLRQPGVEERIEAFALEPVGQRVVVAPALGACRFVVDATGAAHEHEPVHQLGVGEREMEHETCAHRIAEVGRVAALIGDEPGAGPQPGVEAGRAPMARRVDAHHLVIAYQVRGDRSPAVAVLGEAVDEHDSRPAPVDIGVQHAEVHLIRHHAELSTKMATCR